jgi:hypothetical protein
MSNTQEEKKEEALSFVTKKVMVTFYPDICVPTDNGLAIMTRSAICEYQETSESRSFDFPKHLTIVGFADGRKLVKSLQLHVQHFTSITAMVDLD